MKRRLLNLLTLLSMLLFVVIAAAWARAAWWSDVLRGTVGREAPLTFFELKSEGGAAAVTYMPASDYGHFRQYETGRFPRGWFGYGFLCYRTSYRKPAVGGIVPPGLETYYRVQVPYWALLIAAAVLPGVRGGRAWRERRRLARRGLCAHCGYDLRATPDRCPECGTPALARRDAGVV